MTAPRLDAYSDLVARIDEIATTIDAAPLDLLDRYLLFLQVAPAFDPTPIDPAEDDLLDTAGGTD